MGNSRMWRLGYSKQSQFIKLWKKCVRTFEGALAASFIISLLFNNLGIYVGWDYSISALILGVGVIWLLLLDQKTKKFFYSPALTYRKEIYICILEQAFMFSMWFAYLKFYGDAFTFVGEVWKFLFILYFITTFDDIVKSLVKMPGIIRGLAVLEEGARANPNNVGKTHYAMHYEE